MRIIVKEVVATTIQPRREWGGILGSNGIRDEILQRLWQ
jgi:hypothetical protein